MTDFRYEGDPGTRSSRRIRRGKQALVGVAGLAALTAGGLFLVTEVLPTKDAAVAELGAPAPAHPEAPDPAGMPPVEPPGAAPTGVLPADTLDVGPDAETPGDSGATGLSASDPLGGAAAESPDAPPAGPDADATAPDPWAAGPPGTDAAGLPGEDAGDAPGADQAGQGQAEPAPPPSPPVLSAVAPQRSPVPFMSPSMSLAQRVVIVRAAGVPVPAAMPPQLGVGVAPQSVSVTDDGSIEREGATLRVVSAPGNLTGQRELAWVADAGQPVGDAFCSQRFHLGGSLPAGENPALLVCWKLSMLRSVFTVAVNAAGRPSAPFSVAALDREWARLGPEPLPPF